MSKGRVRDDSVVRIVEYMITVLLDYIHCVQHIQSIIDSTLNIFEVHFLKIDHELGVNLQPKISCRVPIFHWQFVFQSSSVAP